MVDLPKPPTVTNFLYFFNLITGNIVVGWVHFALSFLCVLGYIAFLVFEKTSHVEIGDITVDAEPDGFEGTALVVISLILLVVAVFMAFISFWFVRGIKTCDPSKMKPYLIFSAIFVILAFVTTVFTLQFFLLVITAVEIYFFICAYSLYVNFVTQSCGIADVVYQNPSAYGYSQAYENEDYSEGNETYQQQGAAAAQGYGNFDEQQQQKGEFYGTQGGQGQFYGQ